MRQPPQMCTDGPRCQRRVCFFAHLEGEVRLPEGNAPLLSAELQSSLAAGAHCLEGVPLHISSGSLGVCAARECACQADAPWCAPRNPNPMVPLSPHPAPPTLSFLSCACAQRHWRSRAPV